MTTTNLDLVKIKARCPELVGSKLEGASLFLRYPPRHSYSIKQIQAIARQFLALGEVIEKVRDFIGCGIHDEDGNLKSECTISLTELDNCFEWLDEALAARKGEAVE